MTVSCSFARRNSAANASTSGVLGGSRSSASASSGIHGASSGACRLTQASRCADTISSVSSQPAPTTCRRSPRQTKYGVVTVNDSAVADRTRSLSTQPAASSIRRLLPMPASPVISTSLPRPFCASSSAPRSIASSGRRPTSGKWTATAWCSRPVTGGPTDQACTGFALPFALNGSSSRVANARR